MFQKIAKHRANDASNDVHRPPLIPTPKLRGIYSGADMCKKCFIANSSHFDTLFYVTIITTQSIDIQVPLTDKKEVQYYVMGGF